MSKKSVFGISCLIGFLCMVVGILADGSLTKEIATATDRPWTALIGFLCGIYCYTLMPFFALLGCREVIKTKAFGAAVGKSLVVAIIFTPLVCAVAKYSSEIGYWGEPRARQISGHWFVIIFTFVLIASVCVAGAFNPAKQRVKSTAA